MFSGLIPQGKSETVDLWYHNTRREKNALGRKRSCWGCLFYHRYSFPMTWVVVGLFGISLRKFETNHSPIYLSNAHVFGLHVDIFKMFIQFEMVEKTSSQHNRFFWKCKCCKSSIISLLWMDDTSAAIPSQQDIRRRKCCLLRWILLENLDKLLSLIPHLFCSSSSGSQRLGQRIVSREKKTPTIWASLDRVRFFKACFWISTIKCSTLVLGINPKNIHDCTKIVESKMCESLCEQGVLYLRDRGSMYSSHRPSPPCACRAHPIFRFPASSSVPLDVAIRTFQFVPIYPSLF